MICSNCKRIVSDRSIFCSYCGVRFTTDQKPTSSAASMPQKQSYTCIQPPLLNPQTVNSPASVHSQPQVLPQYGQPQPFYPAVPPPQIQTQQQYSVPMQYPAQPQYAVQQKIPLQPQYPGYQPYPAPWGQPMYQPPKQKSYFKTGKVFERPGSTDSVVARIIMAIVLFFLSFSPFIEMFDVRLNLHREKATPADVIDALLFSGSEVSRKSSEWGMIIILVAIMIIVFYCGGFYQIAEGIYRIANNRKGGYWHSITCGSLWVFLGNLCVFLILLFLVDPDVEPTFFILQILLVIHMIICFSFYKKTGIYRRVPFSERFNSQNS